jgi:hypothetical protein
MILAYHSIFSMYGFWLPNDPRGSGSDYVASIENNPLKEGKRLQNWPFVFPFAPDEAIRMAIEAAAMRAAKLPRRIGGAAIRSQQEARRKRRALPNKTRRFASPSSPTKLSHQSASRLGSRQKSIGFRGPQRPMLKHGPKTPCGGKRP